MPHSDAHNALQEARVALECVSTDEEEESIAADNNAFTCLIDAILALKRISDKDSDNFRILDNLHENIIETYTNITKSQGVVSADTRIEYHQRLNSICEEIEDKYGVEPELEG